MIVQTPEKNVHFPSMEIEVLKKWENENTFQKSIDQRPADKKYNFYDGPPFATGLPHFGHFVPGSVKDAFLRYFTMKGFRAERRFGWDCHGVPVELLVQKELNLNGKHDIERFGIDNFNAACRASVTRYTQEWRNYVKRLGRWVDMDNDFKTMEPTFMESVWHVFQQLWDKGLIYEGKFVVSYSTALGTTLSNFEATLDYRDVQDPSVTLKAKLLGEHSGKTLLIWTTTPWTIPANVAIAIDPKGIYAEILDVKSSEKFYILKARISAYWDNETQYQIIREFEGEELHGVSYEPFFKTFQNKINNNAFKIYGTNYVLHDTGTGAVHTAPAFGEDDFLAAKTYHLPLIDHLDANGKFQEDILPELTGLDFKSGDKIIMSYLKQHDFVFKHETFVHSYPHCYRSGVPLMYRAVTSWFVKIEENRELLKKVNEQINWVPHHIKHGRFGKWLDNARDWNIGRSRYWGNPIPIWQNLETKEQICIGSIAELQKYTSEKITDLHIEFVDKIEIPSQKFPGTFLKRTPFVLDCWFESGSMPYAQQHYPFERQNEFSDLFPADFICEGLDQTRGWFYTLTLISSLLRGTPAFKNVVVNGLILAEDGRKMSKSLKNFPDPMITLEEFGADSVRLFLLSTPATVAEECRFSIEGVKECTRRVLLPLWNAYSFFATYASLENFDPEKNQEKSTNPLDIWIELKLNELLKLINKSMTTYHIAQAAPALMNFLDDLNNWYIRRNRRRFWAGDKQAFATLFQVLVSVCQLLAPFAPFTSEYVFSKLALTERLRKAGSVHLTLLADAREIQKDEEKLLEDIDLARRVVELGRNIRVAHRIKNRQPLSEITVGVLNQDLGNKVTQLSEIICEELNVKKVSVTLNPSSLAKIFVKPNFKVLGKSLGDKIKDLQKALSDISQEIALKALNKETFTVNGFTCEPQHVIVELRPSGDQLVATDGNLVAALNPHLSEELKREGIARELVSLIQKARKTADFQVEERISLHLECDEILFQAIQQNAEYIEEETLSSLKMEKPTSARYADCVNCDGEKVYIHLW